MNSLEEFVRDVGASWGPLTTQLAQNTRESMARLAATPTSEPWVKALHQRRPEDCELHRDPRGFLLLTHLETAQRYRPPHDHGRGWVIYAVQHGEVEMRTYGRILDPGGNVRLVQREAYQMGPGDCRIYLPGDIHDTRALSESVLMFRFTSMDLKQEDRAGHITRYVERGGNWTVPQ